MSSDLRALVTISDPTSPASEAYRELRTNLAFAGRDKPLHILMFTSPGLEEGKSTVLANLAVTIAQTERRVLVVDADLRQPCQHEIFGLPNEAGLSTLLSGPVEGAPPAQDTGIPNLRVLTSGPLPVRPADLISSRRMEEVIAQLAADTDMILFDSPPINAVTDGAILAARVQGVVLVVRERHTRRDAVLEARDRLARVHAHLVGTVLNGVSPDRAFAGYYDQAKAGERSEAGAGAEAGAAGN